MNDEPKKAELTPEEILAANRAELIARKKLEAKSGEPKHEQLARDFLTAMGEHWA